MDAYVFHKKMENPQGRFSRAWARTGRKKTFWQFYQKAEQIILIDKPLIFSENAIGGSRIAPCPNFGEAWATEYSAFFRVCKICIFFTL